jgi:hypothetical protein
MSEIVQQGLRGAVEVLGIAVPGIAVGLAAVPPKPLAYHVQAIDRRVDRTAAEMDHRREHLSAALHCAESDCRQQARESLAAVSG